jgi:hypothetical protein
MRVQGDGSQVFYVGAEDTLQDGMQRAFEHSEGDLGGWNAS